LFIRSELERNSGGSTFKELTKSSLEKIRIVSVPKEEQEKIADIIDNFDKALHQNRLHKELSCALKKRLTNSFLSGELLVLKEDVN
jgi:restriction endonuclease S subunit